MLTNPDQFTWNAIINAHAKLGECATVLGLFDSMLQEGKTPPDKFTFMSIMKSCSKTVAIEQGRNIHEQIIEIGCQFDIAVGSTLIHMYCKCWSLKEARKIFNTLPHHDVVSWNAMIAGYAQQGESDIAIDCLKEMQCQGIRADNVTLLSILKACGSLDTLDSLWAVEEPTVNHNLIDSSIINDNIGRYKKLEICRWVQSFLVQNVLVATTVLANHLICLFFASGSLFEAHQVFDGVLTPDQYTWNVLIDVHATVVNGGIEINLYHKMNHDGNKPPDRCTFLAILKWIGTIGSIEQGRYIHAQVLENGMHSDIVVGSSLVGMYSKCGSLKEAEKVFQGLLNLDVVSWNAMLAVYVYHGKGDIVLDRFENMQHEGIEPSTVTFLSVLKSCAAMGAMEQGRCVHEQIIERGLQFHVTVGNTLIDMYTKCMGFEEAARIFYMLPNEDVVLWNTMIGGYVQHDESLYAITCFEDMRHAGVKADKASFLSILKACGSLGAINLGRYIHQQIVEVGLEADIVIGSALVDMYAKCGELNEARKVFECLSDRDVILWSVMIAGYVQHEEELIAIECFSTMQQEGVEADARSFSSIMKACASVGALQQGRHTHEKIIEIGFQADIVTGNTLVDMYANCGSLQEAHMAFISMPSQDEVSWNVMIAGYAQHGKAQLAVDCFDNMQPNIADDVAFVGLLISLSHAGLLDEGIWYFKFMKDGHCIEPSVLHIACMIDLLGRAGYFRDAEDLLQHIININISLWMSLLSACSMHHNLELGRRCFNAIVSLDSHPTAAYVLMSNIYATAQIQTR